MRRSRLFLPLVLLSVLAVAEARSGLAAETQLDVTYMGTAQGELRSKVSVSSSCHRYITYTGSWAVWSFAGDYRRDGPGQPFGMYYKFQVVSQDSADVEDRSPNGVYKSKHILSLQTVQGEVGSGSPVAFMEHYPAINEYRCCLLVEEYSSWTVGLEIQEFWTNGTDFYLKAGEAPDQPGECLPYDCGDLVWYSDLVLYTSAPISTEASTWGRIKSMMR